MAAMSDRTFYLVGGDEFTDTTKASDRHVLSRYSLGTVCVVPTAAKDSGPLRAMQNGIDYFSSLGAESRGAAILTGPDAHDSQLVHSLRSADLVYFTGGHPENITELLDSSPALDALRDASRRGAVIAGSSAGAMALGPRFRCPRHGWFDGLRFVEFISVPHAESMGSSVFAEIVETVGASSKILALPSGTGCLVAPEGLVPVGPEAVRVFANDRWNQLEAGSIDDQFRSL